MTPTRVHHLNCGTMRLPGIRVVCHVLLIETDGGLVLVDSGFGRQDVARPAERLGWYRHVSRPVLAVAETASAQVEALGFATDDVRHILLTHFDSDHAGGIADFPHARVHTTAIEWSAARRPSSRVEHGRYRQTQWSHGPDVVTHGPGGESWRGFAAARPLDDVAPGLVMIPLPGHTRGHAAYAVDLGHTWLLHAGDAFYHRGALGGTRQPAMLAVQERVVAVSWRQVRENHARLGELHREDDVTVVNAHDPELFAAARRR